MEHRFDEILKVKAIDHELSYSGSRSANEISDVGSGRRRCKPYEGGPIASLATASSAEVLSLPFLAFQFAATQRLFQFLTPRQLDEALNRRLSRLVREFVGSHYTEKNARTSSLIGIDLKTQGYM